MTVDNGNINVTISIMKFRLIEFVEGNGRSPFGDWFESLDSTVAARIHRYLRRVEFGNFGDTRSVGNGVHELKVHFGPGYRVYFAREGAVLVVLLGGGDKGSQSRDIEQATAKWRRYQAREV